MPLSHTTNTYDPSTLKLLTNEHIGVYAGKVLAEYRQTTRVMSDIWEDVYYALVWDVDGPKVIASPRDAVVDATPDVVDAYRSWYAGKVVDALKALHQNTASVPEPGKVVVVKHGRKDRGKVGKIVYKKEMPYSMGYRSTYLPKLCVALDGSTIQVAGKYGKTFTKYTNVIWVWAKNVEVVNPTPPDMEEIQKRADELSGQAVSNLSRTYFAEYDGPTRIYT